MKDLVGQELAVGDRVVYADSHYSSISVGIIEKLTPKSVRVGGTIRASDRVYKVCASDSEGSVNRAVESSDKSV